MYTNEHVFKFKGNNSSSDKSYWQKLLFLHDIVRINFDFIYTTYSVRGKAVKGLFAFLGWTLPGSPQKVRGLRVRPFSSTPPRRQPHSELRGILPLFPEAESCHARSLACLKLIPTQQSTTIVNVSSEFWPVSIMTKAFSPEGPEDCVFEIFHNILGT